MSDKPKVQFRKTTAGELVAQMFEADAKAMPPSMKDQAKILREQAKSARLLLTKPIMARIRYKDEKDDF
jgi:hypothetical protein